MSTTNTATRDSFIQAQDAIAQAAEEKAAQRQHAKHKLTARERLALFFDDGVWHEVGQFIGGFGAARPPCPPVAARSRPRPGGRGGASLGVGSPISRGGRALPPARSTGGSWESGPGPPKPWPRWG